jgi:hypothetical protein
MLSTHPERPSPCAKVADRSNKLIIPVTSNLFNHRHNVMLVEHRSRAITTGHVFEPFAYLANIQSTLPEKRM